ncbi:MAG TPA: Spy/CpxP family protein refolding chaperone [Spirochaetota bacterium]|nr:Spy/CpxP family protein refolding chaperone [Spirochaetota bacterium]HPJ38896.1 Spy/CpxP family protein refolding chaperone [Spirochaetota bacterium]HPQ52027.1 Spy/CpxP family protein refolding chaperone [Spirochaetota bacterium]
MKRNTVFIAAGILILIAAVGVYFYKTADMYNESRFCEGPPPEGPPGEGPHGRGRMLAMLRRELRLTDDQYNAILKLHEQNDIALTKNRYRVHRMMDVLKKELLNSEFHEQRVRKILEDIDALKREDRIRFIKIRFAMKKILTAEQAEEFDRILDKRFRSFHKRHRFDRDRPRHEHHRRGRDD